MWICVNMQTDTLTQRERDNQAYRVNCIDAHLYQTTTKSNQFSSNCLFTKFLRALSKRWERFMWRKFTERERESESAVTNFFLLCRKSTQFVESISAYHPLWNIIKHFTCVRKLCFFFFFAFLPGNWYINGTKMQLQYRMYTSKSKRNKRHKLWLFYRDNWEKESTLCIRTLDVDAIDCV